MAKTVLSLPGQFEGDDRGSYEEPCMVRGKGCSDQGKGPTGLIQVFDGDDIQSTIVCRECYELKTKTKEWVIED